MIAKPACLQIGCDLPYSFRMVKFIRTVKCPNGYSVCFIIATLLLIGVLLYWQTTSQYQQFIQQQKLLAEQSVSGAANEIAAYLDDLKYQVALFAEDEIAIIRQVARDPENMELLDQLNKEVASHFPNHFAVTIANASGVPIIGNFDLQINELCQSDIKKFARSGYRYDVFIHPHPETQHFDIMTPIDLYGTNTPGENQVLFISFKPTIIQRYLGNSQVFGHTLYLLKDNIDGLIELTAEGTRVDLIRANKNHILPEGVLERVDYMIPVRGTQWNLVSIADAALYGDQISKITVRAIYIFVFFLLISFMYLAFLFHFEKKRKQSDQVLKLTKDLLQHTLNFSNIGTWEYDFINDKFTWPDDTRAILMDQSPHNLNNYLAITHVNDRQGVKNYFEDIASALALTHEHRIYAPDRKVYWVELSGAIDKDENPPFRILGLIRDITTRKHIEQVRLAEEKQHRETLVREVHHRIKNNLQGVIGLLRRQSNKGELSQGTFDHAISQLNSVSLIHGLSCASGNNRILLSDLITAIVDAANNFTGTSIRPKIGSNPHCYLKNEDKAIAVALIVNELITNAIKHSNRNPGEISMQIHCLNSRAEVVISNPCANTTPDFDYANNSGLGAGLNLIKSLVPKRGASLVINKHDNCVVATLNLTEPVIEISNEQSKPEKQIA